MRYEILHLRAKSLFNPFLCMIPIMTWNICMEKGLSAKFQLEISQNKIRNSRRRQSRTPSSYSKPYLEGQVNQLYKQINSQFNTGYFVNSDDIEQEISKAGFKNLSRFRLKLIIKRMAPSSKVFPQCLKTYDQFI